MPDMKNFNGLTGFGDNLNVAVFGASGGIGKAFIEHLANDPSVAKIFALSRSAVVAGHRKVISRQYDPYSDDSLSNIAEMIGDVGGLHLGIAAIGMLHDKDRNIGPEKSWRDLSPDDLAATYSANTIAPVMVMKHMLPLLPRDRRAGFAALSARVGSISDNRIGGWYGYRAAKAALNQHIRCAAIELARKHSQAFCIGLHPGTVDTALSEPFQKNVAAEKLFSTAYSTACMLNVLNCTTPANSGRLFAYDGSEIEP